MKNSLPLFATCLMLAYSTAAQQLYWAENGDSYAGNVVTGLALSNVNNVSSNTDDWVFEVQNTDSGGDVAEVSLGTALTLSGYPESGTGNSLEAGITNGTANATQNVSIFRRLGNTSGSQSIYLSMIYNVYNIRRTTDIKSFSIGFGEVTNDDGTPSNVTLQKATALAVNSTGFTNNDADGPYELGVTKWTDASSTSVSVDESNSYTANGNDTGDVLFVLLKYTMDDDTGNGNDKIQLYVSSTVPSSEPTSWNVTVESSGQDWDVNAIFIREKFDSNFDHEDEFSNIRVADSWGGLFDSFWNGSSWSLGPPTSALGGIVDSDLTISSAFSAKSLTVKTGNTLTVNSGNSVTITGGHVILASGASLISYGSDVSGIQYTRKSSFTDDAGQYSFIGSPVQNFNIQDLGGAFHYVYNATTEAYESYGSGAMSVGVGYTSANKQELVFSGTPNTGDVAIALNTDNSGWNFVANPYAAAIDVAEFINTTNNPNITGAVYLWDDGGSDNGQRTNTDFITVNSSGSTGGSGGSGATYNDYIGTAQGFFVEASGSGNVSFTESMRASGNNQDDAFFRETSIARFNLQVEGSNKLKDNILIAFNEEGTEGFDQSYDASKFYTTKELALASLQKDGKELAIQTLPPLESYGQPVSIPLKLEVTQLGTYTFGLSSYEMPQDYEVYLVDKQTHTHYPLKKGVNLEIAQSSADRFELLIDSHHFTEVLSADESSDLIAYVAHQKLHVLLNALSGRATLTLFDLGGRNVMNSKVNFDTAGALKLDLAGFKKGVYVLSILQAERKLTVKFINQ